jgi:hypothetical protein
MTEILTLMLRPVAHWCRKLDVEVVDRLIFGSQFARSEICKLRINKANFARS